MAFVIIFLGVDSLMATQLRNTFSSSFQSMLSSTLLFDHTTLSALLEFLSPIVDTQLAEQPEQEENDETENEDEDEEQLELKSTEERSRKRSVDATPNQIASEFALTNAQQGLWFLWKMFPESAAYPSAIIPKFRLISFLFQ